MNETRVKVGDVYDRKPLYYWVIKEILSFKNAHYPKPRTTYY